jgi:hypothetical protein
MRWEHHRGLMGVSRLGAGLVLLLSLGAALTHEAAYAGSHDHASQCVVCSAANPPIAGEEKPAGLSQANEFPLVEEPLPRLVLASDPCPSLRFSRAPPRK